MASHAREKFRRLSISRLDIGNVYHTSAMHNAPARGFIAELLSLLSGSPSHKLQKAKATWGGLTIRCWGGFDLVTALPDDMAGGAKP